jgi:hypothetical protein
MNFGNGRGFSKRISNSETLSASKILMSNEHADSTKHIRTAKHTRWDALFVPKVVASSRDGVEETLTPLSSLPCCWEGTRGEGCCDQSDFTYS